MIVMVSNHSGTEVGYLAGRYPGALGHLYSPGGQRGPYRFLPYALDNGAFPAYLAGQPWQPEPWRELLRWAAWSMQAPLWSLVPDVVADREATLRAWSIYLPEVQRWGFRPAFAVQDGMTFKDIPDDAAVLFIGGSDEFKDEAIGPWCRRFPGRVHVGRVTTADRLLRCYRAGAVSVDGNRWFTKNVRVRRGGGGGGQQAELVKFIEETHGRRQEVAA